jgi:hypothetical protein
MMTLASAINATIAKEAATGTIKNDDSRSTEWHRLSGDRSNAAPEHERLQCVESVTWTCLYTKIPEPGFNFHWDAQQETFAGGLTARDQWSCPTWFPITIALTSIAWRKEWGRGRHRETSVFVRTLSSPRSEVRSGCTTTGSADLWPRGTGHSTRRSRRTPSRFRSMEPIGRHKTSWLLDAPLVPVAAILPRTPIIARTPVAALTAVPVCRRSAGTLPAVLTGSPVIVLSSVVA